MWHKRTRGSLFDLPRRNSTKSAQCVVPMLIDNWWKNKIRSFDYINERMVTTRLKIRRGYFRLWGTYSHKEEKKKETEEFYEILQKQINKTIKNDYM